MTNGDKKTVNNEFKFEITAWRGYVQAKMENTGEKITRIENKLDHLLEKDLVTNDSVRDAIKVHTETCPVRANPGESVGQSGNFMNRGMSVWASTYSKLGVVGGLIGIIFLLLVAILKLAEVF